MHDSVDELNSFFLVAVEQNIVGRGGVLVGHMPANTLHWSAT